MAISLGINRDVQVSYSVSAVKAAVEEVAAKSTVKYQIEDRNDAMNTFTIALIGGFAVIVPITLQLKKVSDTETQIILTSNKATNTGNQANDIADAFLSKVSQALSGTLDEVEVKAVDNRKWYTKKRYLILIISFIILFLMSKWSPFYS